MRKGLLLCPPALLAGDGGQHPFISAWAAQEQVHRVVADMCCHLFTLCNRVIQIKAPHECAFSLQGSWDLNLSVENTWDTLMSLPQLRAGLGLGQSSSAWLSVQGLMGREDPSWPNHPLAVPPPVQPLHHLPAHQVVQQLP